MPNKKSDYYTYHHDDPRITTMGDFVGGNGVSSIGAGFDIVKLLNYEDASGTKNIDNLTSLYIFEESKQFDALLQRVASSSKEQAVKTSTVPTSNGQVSVTSANQQQAGITLKPNMATRLNANLADFDAVYGHRVLSAKHQQSLIDKIPDPQVRKLFKKLVFQVFDTTNYIVYVTSGFRTLQEELAEVRKGNKLAPVNTSTVSPHVSGLAIDINLMSKTTNQIAIKADSPVGLWNLSGVPQIATKLGLRWGGSSATFVNGQPDPVHFDAVYYYSVNSQAVLDSQGGTASDEVTQEVSQNSLYADLPIHIGTVLNLPLTDIDRDILATETNQVTDTSSFESFLARELYFLLREPNYTALFPEAKKGMKTPISQVKEVFPYMSVWVWSRALSVYSSGEYAHKILNVTPYVSSLNTIVAENGGSFSVELSPNEGEVLNDHWRMAQYTQQAAKTNEGDYVSQNFLHYEEDGELKRSNFFFEKALQHNDIVFIRFEKLIIEEKRENQDDLETISLNDLPSNVFDMIGLIDTVNISTQPSSASVVIGVQGRDLSKLLIDDGVYFYPVDFMSGGIFANETGAANQRLRRFGSRGEVLARFQAQNRTIDRSLKYIMNTLSSIDICPTDLFNGYANAKLLVSQPSSESNTVDKRSKAYQLDSDAKTQAQDRQRDLDAKRSEVIAGIDDTRRASKLTQGTATDTYTIIESFLKARLANSEITSDTVKGITGWSEVRGDNATHVNESPSDLLDRLFIRTRAWVDSQYRPITGSKERQITDSIESLFSLVDYTKLSANGGFPVFSQVSRALEPIVFTGASSKKLNLERTYKLSDLLTEVRKQVDDIVVFDATSYGLDLSSVLKSSSTVSTFKATLSTVERDYKAFLKSGNEVLLAIVDKRLGDYTTDVKKAFDDTLDVIKEQSGLDQAAPTTLALLPVNGIWQIVKLVVDQSVRNRLVADASIGNEHGSLLNAIRKLCQDPFCEFFTDTYGDQFYFIVRKKPFDAESVRSWLSSRVTYETIDPSTQQVIVASAKTGSTTLNSKAINDSTINPTSIVIDIDELDVLSDSLSFSQEAYSWYRIQLKNLISGSDADMAFAYLKAVYFNEYADVFGSRPLDVTNSYIPYQNVVSKNQELPTASFIEQGVYDLKYLIESHAYLPFTRQGTITINGDRRIKKGTFIRYKATSEICYVDSVSHAFSIGGSSVDRTTTLQVSRCMVEKYINGVTLEIDGKDVFVSYFNVCDLPVDPSVFTKQQEGESDLNRLVLSRWKVNPVSFNFFLRRLQFTKHSNEVTTR